MSADDKVTADARELAEKVVTRIETYFPTQWRGDGERPGVVEQAAAVLAPVVARAEAAELEVAMLIWNLAGCDTIASGHSKPGEFNTDLARPALHSVSKLRQERDQLRDEVERLRSNEWQHYRMLKEGEMVQVGDEYLCGDEEPPWKLHNDPACNRPAPNPSYPAHTRYRRRIADDLRAELNESQTQYALQIITNDQLRAEVERLTQVQADFTAWQTSVIATIGGEVDGQRTSNGNYLQRLRDLVAVEAEKPQWILGHSKLVCKNTLLELDLADLRAQLAALEASERKARYEREDARQSLEYCREQLAAAKQEVERLTKELAAPITEQALRARNNGALPVGNGCEIAVRGTTAQLIDARQAVAAAREDKERLDWLEEFPYRRTEDIQVLYPITPKCPGPGTVRAAIDAARREGGAS